MAGQKKTDHPEADESSLRQNFELTRVQNLVKTVSTPELREIIEAIIDE